MLIQFNFSNFTSFREKTSLDLTATKITEHASHIESIANEKILKTAVIYGANASGKSNVYSAFEFMSLYVADSYKYGGESETASKNQGRIIVTPFLFDKNSRNKPSTFEVFFTDSTDSREKIYQYGFALDENEVKEEWLFVKSKSKKEYDDIFYRENGKVVFSPKWKSAEVIINSAVEKESLVVSTGSKLKIDILKKVRNWFLRNEFANFGDPVENLFWAGSLPHKFTSDASVQNKVVEYFHSFDKSIRGFDVEKVGSGAKGEVYKIDTHHLNIDTGSIETIPLKSESSGTLKMFSLYQEIKDILKRGGVLFVDELNSKLHPLLVRNIVLTFLNKDINSKGAQLIFTTHDTWQLSNDLFRRDEIWFVEKEHTGISYIYSFADYIDESGNKIRKDENYEKNYLLGNYGAIPELESFYVFKEE